jgi:probable HAF family extracellular repeat protein
MSLPSLFKSENLSHMKPVALFFCALISCGFAQLRAGNTISAIGTPGEVTFSPRAFNNVGQIVGESFSSGVYTAMLYSGGTFTDLGALGGLANSSATAINDLGAIVGTSTTGTGGFLYEHGQFTMLPTFAGGTLNNPQGINNLGQITGTANVLGNWPSPNSSYGYLYSQGTMTSIGGLGDPDGLWGSRSFGLAINDSGQIAGASGYGENRLTNPAVYRNGQLEWLNGVAYYQGSAVDINSAGVMVANVGYIEFVPYIYYPDGSNLSIGPILKQLFGSEYGQLYAINDAGYAVGTSQVGGSFLYSPDGAIYLLKDLVTMSDGTVPGFTRLSGIDMNDVGQILGVGRYFDGTNYFENTGFVIQLEAVPEPSVLGMIFVGAGAAVLFGRRQATRA